MITMPSVGSFRDQAPFTLDSLIEAANMLLHSSDGFMVSVRTVRYYITRGALEKPSGPPKFARYKFEHLIGIVAIRALQDQGRNLRQISEMLEPMWKDQQLDQALEIAEKFVESRTTAAELDRDALLEQMQHETSPEETDLPLEVIAWTSSVHRLKVSEAVTLEVDGKVDMQEALEEAKAKLEEMLQPTS